jgi:hypothetical protein
MRKRIKLNVRFINENVVCAKSPGQCNKCKDIKQCEKMDFYYYPFKERDIEECFKNSERRR